MSASETLSIRAGAAVDVSDLRQVDRIFSRLAATPGEWVSMPELAAAGKCYAVHSRISDLRAAGHNVEQRCEGSRPRKSFYRLVFKEA